MFNTFSFDFQGKVIEKIELAIERTNKNTIYEATLKLFIEQRENGVSRGLLENVLRLNNTKPTRSVTVLLARLLPRLHSVGLQLAHIKYEATGEVVYYIVPIETRVG